MTEQEIIKTAERLYVYHGYTLRQLEDYTGTPSQAFEKYRNAWNERRDAFLKLPGSGQTRLSTLLLREVAKWESGKPYKLDALLKVQAALSRERSSLDAFMMCLNAFDLHLVQASASEDFLLAYRGHAQQFLAEFKLSLISQGGKV
jgi:hypothetical protein